MRSRFILGIVGVLAVLLLFSACPNQLMRDLVEQKLASPAAGLFQINLGAAGTAVQSVTLRSQVSKNNDALEMRFKNESGDWSAWQKYSDSAGWTLTPGDNGSLGALKTVYAEFRDEGHHVVSLQDSIVYCAAVPNGNFFVWGTGTQAGALHTQINTINSSLYISVADAVDMRFNNDGGAWSAWMPYSTTAAWPLSAIDGARTVNAEFRNAGGSNVLTPNYTINLDTIAPTFGAPLSINGAAPVSYSPSVSLTYATPDGIWVEFQNDGGAWTARETLASPRTWTLNASAGSRTVGVRITDVAGNQTVGAPAGINLVTSPPAPSTVSPTAALRPTWTWPAFSGATTYRMQMDSTAGAWTVIGNVTSYTPGSDLSIGMHTFYLQAQDSAGNWSATGSSPVTIDLSAPGAPTLTVASPTTDNTPTWSWLALPDTASYLYQLDTTTGSWTEVPSSTLSFTPGSSLSDGQHTLFLQAKKNLTGTLSPMASATTVVDTVPPTLSIGAPSVSIANAGTAVTYTITYSGATVINLTTGSVSLNTTGSAVGTVLSVSGSGVQRTVTIQTGSGDGTVAISIAAGTASDAAGNVSLSAGPSGTFTVDNTAPLAPVAGAGQTASPTINRLPTWVWASGGGGNGTFRYKLNDSNLGIGTTTTTATSYTPSSNLARGKVHTLYIQECDAAGNWSASYASAIQVDFNVMWLANAPLGPTGAFTDDTYAYIAGFNNSAVTRVPASGGSLVTIAGTGSFGYGGDGGSAVSALLNSPTGGCVDPAGNVYIADFRNHRIRVVNASGIISNFAGSGAYGDDNGGYSGDGGLATASRLNYPFAICRDGAGNYYITELGNHVIRKISASGIITTIAGNGTAGDSGDGGPAVSAGLNYPTGICLDASGNIYFGEELGHRIRKITAATGIITTIAGNGTGGYSGDGGPASAALVNGPQGICVDGSGNIFFADFYNNRIRRIDAATGIITTVAGTGTAATSGDGGLSSQASFNMPEGLCIDSSGNLYVAERNGNVLRKLY